MAKKKFIDRYGNAYGKGVHYSYTGSDLAYVDEYGRRRRGKSEWVHCVANGVEFGCQKRNEDGFTTLCEKTAYRIRVTRIKENVTCPRCLEVMKADKGEAK